MTKTRKIQAAKKVRKHIVARGKSENFDITPDMLAYWWKHINVAIFDDALPAPVEFIVTDLHNSHGEAETVNKKNNVRIYIDETISTREAVIAVLVHEMVHQWQMVSRKKVPKYRRMSHGKTFYRWRPIIEEKLGVKLTRITDEFDVLV